MLLLLLAIKNIGSSKKTCAILGAIYQQAAPGFNSKDIVFHALSILAMALMFVFIDIPQKKQKKKTRDINSATGEF